MTTSTNNPNSTTAQITKNMTTPNATTLTSSKIMTSTVSLSASTTLNATSNSTTAATSDSGGMSEAKEIAIGIVFSVVVIAIIAIALFKVLQYFGKLPLFCYRTRKRRSSTSSSRRALDEDSCADNSSLHRPNEKLKQTTEEMFTIDDFEEDVGDRDREEYFYDEVFGQSEFEDETTKNSVRQLYTSHDDNDEMLDFDFETLGIRADGFSREAAGKVTI